MISLACLYIFIHYIIATCNAMMRTEKYYKLQTGCHTFAIFLQLAKYPLESIILKSSASKGCILIGSFKDVRANCLCASLLRT